MEVPTAAYGVRLVIIIWKPFTMVSFFRTELLNVLRIMIELFLFDWNKNLTDAFPAQIHAAPDGHRESFNTESIPIRMVLSCETRNMKFFISTVSPNAKAPAGLLTDFWQSVIRLRIIMQAVIDFIVRNQPFVLMTFSSKDKPDINKVGIQIQFAVIDHAKFNYTMDCKMISRDNTPDYLPPVTWRPYIHFLIVGSPSTPSGGTTCPRTRF